MFLFVFPSIALVVPELVYVFTSLATAGFTSCVAAVVSGTIIQFPSTRDLCYGTVPINKTDIHSG